jgi:hypothetical protein
LVSLQRFYFVIVGVNNSISDSDVFERFDVANKVSDFAGFEFINGFSLWDELPEFKDFVVNSCAIEPNLVSPFDLSGHESYVSDRAAIVIVMGVKDHRLQVSRGHA